MAWSNPGPVASGAQTEFTQDDLRAATKEALDAEVELDKLRREVPDCTGSETEFQKYLRERATAEKLVIEFQPVAGKDRLPLAGGAPSPVELRRFDLTARAACEKAQGSFDRWPVQAPGEREQLPFTPRKSALDACPRRAFGLAARGEAASEEPTTEVRLEFLHE